MHLQRWVRGSFFYSLLFVSFASPLSAERPRPLGRLVDVGGYRVHLYCRGSGSPAVIITGAGYSFDWGLVQPEIAKHTEVCAYDHSDVAWSDPGPADSCALRVKELHAALVGARVSGPYVLVGHSLGALVSRLYALTYPQQVAGVVFVDHAVPSIGTHKPLSALPSPLFEAAKPPSATSSSTLSFAPPLSPATSAKDELEWQKLPLEDFALHQWADALPNHQAVMDRNREVGTECAAQVQNADHGQAPELGNKPLIVLSSPALAANAESLANLSSKGLSIVVPDTGHFIMIDQPQAVIAAVLQVLSEAQEQAKK